MQTQTGKSTFWNKLVACVEALESTPFDHQQIQLERLHSDIYEVSRRLKIIESGIATTAENRRENESVVS